jgi:hypothetical protein
VIYHDAMHLFGHKCSLLSHHDKINLSQSPYRATQSEDCQNQCDMPFLPQSLCWHQFECIYFDVDLNTQANWCNKKI